MNHYMKCCLLLLCLWMTISSGLSSPNTILATSLPNNTDPVIDWSGEDEELQQILQSSLSVLEIDKEIVKIEARLLELKEYLYDSELILYERELEIDQKRELAGEALRSYYVGDHQNLYLSLLNVDDIQQFFYLLEIIQYIISKDHEALNSYINDYKELEALYVQYEQEQQRLVEMNATLKKQRERVVQLEQQIDQQLHNRPDAERVALLIEQLQNYWNTQGMQYVEAYFQKLAMAMNQLPTWLQHNKQYMTSKGFTYTITLPDDALNEYLREYDPMFEHFEFVFSDHTITARGSKDQLDIEISGSYTLVESPDNFIKFEIDELLFNGFALPDTTKAELMEKFDLNFYPQLLVKFLKATEVEINSDALKIVLKLSL